MIKDFDRDLNQIVNSVTSTKWAAAIIGLAILALGWRIYTHSFSHFENDEEATPIESTIHTVSHEVTIKGIPTRPTIATDVKDFHGNDVSVSCTTCHSTREKNKLNRQASDLNQFHQGLKFQHGTLSCLSCHNSTNYDTLKLSDDTVIEFPDTMQLCAQCHGPQYRDYQAGSHGGMNGYWDLSRGPRTRNACNVCHDPHSPAYPQVQPVFEPLDGPEPHHPSH